MAIENSSTSSRRAACCHILGLEPYSTREEIKSAYKQSALKWHPDRQKSQKEYAKDRFVEIHEAYQTLMNMTPMSPPMSRDASGFNSSPSPPASKPSEFYSQSTGSTSSWTSSRPPSNTSTPRTSTDDLPTPKASKHSKTHSKTSTDGFRRARTRTLSRVKKSDRAQFTRTESSNSSRSNNSKSHHSSSRHHHTSRSHKSDRPEPSSPDRSHSSSDKGKERSSPSKHSHSRSERSSDRSDRSDRDDHRRHRSHRHRSRSRSRSRDRDRSERSESSRHSDKGKERDKGRSKDTKVEEPEAKTEKAEKKPTRPHKMSDKEDRSPPKEKAEEVEEEVGDLPPQTSEPPLRPPIIGIPLRPSRAPDTNNSDWIFPLPLTLGELYSGINYRFQITRQLRTSDSHPTSTPKSTHSSLDDETNSSMIHIDVNIPPGGYKNQTQMRFEGLGNQQKSDGTFQDIVFVIQEVLHDRFIRIQDDLVARIELTWDEALQKEDVILVDGLDGEKIEVPIPKVPDDSKETRIPKAGMPTRNANDEVVGRGDLVIRWEFVFPQKQSSSKWRALKSKFSWQPPKASAS